MGNIRAALDAAKPPPLAELNWRLGREDVATGRLTAHGMLLLCIRYPNDARRRHLFC
jgi:hypothetical protein